MALATAVPLAVKSYGPFCKSYDPIYKSICFGKIGPEVKSTNQFLGAEHLSKGARR
jgi:hypothetical protein